MRRDRLLLALAPCPDVVARARPAELALSPRGAGDSNVNERCGVAGSASNPGCTPMGPMPRATPGLPTRDDAVDDRDADDTRPHIHPRTALTRRPTKRRSPSANVVHGTLPPAWPGLPPRWPRVPLPGVTTPAPWLRECAWAGRVALLELLLLPDALGAGDVRLMRVTDSAVLTAAYSTHSMKSCTCSW